LIRNCLLKHVIEGRIEGKKEVMGRQRRRHKQLLDNLKGKKKILELKKEAQDCTRWRNHCGRRYVNVIQQTME